MKNITFLSIMVCFSFMLATVGCEKSPDQAQTLSTGQNWPLTVRTPLDECSDCPDECCCCGIEIISLYPIYLELCGLCEGDYLCGTFTPPGTICSTVSGTGKDINLTPSPGRPREVFCVAPGATFRIRNTDPNLSASFKFTCKYDVTPYTFITVTLQPGESRFFLNDGSCITDGCH